MNTETQITASNNIFADDGALTRAIRLSEIMATAKTLPEHLAGSPGDCLRVVELALRTNQSPYAIADKTFLVKGKISFEGQLCAALVNANPKLATNLNYAYEGDENKPEGLSVTVSATLKGEDKPRSVVCHWSVGHEQSPSNKALWKKQPAQQLAYMGARVWSRRHCPEILLGLYTPDEIEEEERQVKGRVLPDAVAPAVPPKKEAKALEDPLHGIGLSDKTVDAMNRAMDSPTLDCHDDLREKLAEDGISEEDFLRWVTAEGKNVPKGGYWALEDIPEEKVIFALGMWSTVVSAAKQWLIDNLA